MSQIFTEVEDPFLPQAPAKWPSILGWIMLIWGVLGVILAIWGFMNKSLALETYQGLPDWMVAAWRVMQIAGTVVTIIGALSGWFLRKRMRRGYALAMWWVVLTFLLNVGGLAIQITKRDEMQALMKRNMLAELEKQNQPAPQFTPEMIKGIWFASAGCGGLMGILPPIVIGVILLSAKRKAEVAAWPH
jgi:hypothetical protein